MKNIYSFLISIGIIITVVASSCNKDLNRDPTNGILADSVYGNISGCKQALARCYAAYALTGTTGSSSSDLGGIDAGTADFVRLLWDAQELTTDEAICSWNDAGLPDFHNLSWTSSNTFLMGLYNRSIYQITVCNDFLKNTTSAMVASHGITDTADIRHFRAEVRFLRAFQYSVLMDLFGNPPFVDENSVIGSTTPPQISRATLFNYVVGELRTIAPDMVAAKGNEYGRADQGADWALLSRVYLNAKIYSGTAHYDSASYYATQVINSGYSLMSKYSHLFMADNNSNNPEVILSVNYDGVYSQNYGGTTFIINSAVNSAMNPTAFGIPSGGWGGNRSTSNLPLVFGDYSGATDTRAMFTCSGASTTLKITSVTTFTQGLPIVKFTNLNSDGTTPASSNGVFCSTDFPLFRLAEMYLNRAESEYRLGQTAEALSDINVLRERAYGNNSGNQTTLTLDSILNERERELYWECFRRTDLIRFGYFTSSSYLWPWKGGVAGGQGVDSHYELFPIPATDIYANSNLKQNSGY